MTVFLTGVTGLLGHELAQQLLEKGYRVKALIRDSNKAKLVHSNLEYVEGDILDVVKMYDYIREVDYVYHAAAVVSFAPKDRDLMFKTNVEGTANVVNAAVAANIQKMCHVSSIASFGRPSFAEMKRMDKVVINENQKWVSSETNSNYAITKYEGECEVWRGIAEGLNAVIVNPSIILGESDWNISSTQLFKYVYEEKPFYPEGYLNYVDVKDVAKSMILLTESDISSERFCVSADMISYKEFFDRIADKFGKKKTHIKITSQMMVFLWRFEKIKSFFTNKAPLITKETAKTAQLKIYQSNQKIRKALGFEFRTLDDTLERICSSLVK